MRSEAAEIAQGTQTTEAAVGLSLINLLVILLGALILMVPTFFNRDVFLYRDTTTYFKGAEAGFVKLIGPRAALAPPIAASSELKPGPGMLPGNAKKIASSPDKFVYAGRSIYYGALLYLSLLTGAFFLAIFVQAVLASATLFLFTAAVAGLSWARFLASIGILAVATPLGYFANLAMPDVFAGLIVVAIPTLLLGFPRLTWNARLLLLVVIAFGALGHSSHIPLAVLTLAGGIALLMVLKVPVLRSRMPMTLIVAAILVGLTGEVAFNQASRSLLGQTPLRLPHLSAHLVEMGPGTVYLNSHCGEVHFAICDDRAKFPVTWTQFLFSAAPDKGVFAPADLAQKREISEEQTRFAMAVFRDQPLAVTLGSVQSFLTQLAQFRLDEVDYPPSLLTRFASRLPADEFIRLRASGAAHANSFEAYLSVTTYATAVIAVIVFIGAFFVRLPVREGPRTEFVRLRQAASVLLIGIAANALVCGVLASPYDRFQARVIWLLPFAALLLLAYFRISPEKEHSHEH